MSDDLPHVPSARIRVLVADDDWTAFTENGSMAAHFEHTVAITDEGPWVLTKAGAALQQAGAAAHTGGVHGA